MPPRGGGGQEEEVWQVSEEGAPDASGEAGRPDEWEGGVAPPPAAPQQGYIRTVGGVDLSMAECADLQGLFTAR